jgi:transposase
MMLGPSSRNQTAQGLVAGDRNRPHKHVQRAKIILLSADRLSVQEVARRAGVSRPAVWRWQVRYAEAGVDGLLHDRMRKPGTAPLSTVTIAKVLALTCSKPPGAATHWTGRVMAEVMGISLRAVQRIWEANHRQPHRLRTFTRSTDPAFAAKVGDIVGLYMNPPVHAVLVSMDESEAWKPRAEPRSRRWTAPSPVCRSSPANARP